jgi:hypothetical protein
MEKFMKNLNSKRVFDFNEVKFKANKKMFAMCSKDGAVAGEALAKTNEVLEGILEDTEAQVIDLKKDVIFEAQAKLDAEKAKDEMAVELAGTKILYAEAVGDVTDLKAEVAELKGLIANKSKPKPKAKK